MKNYFVLIALLLGTLVFSQKNFIDQPYIETAAEADTLVVPDRIYLKITISENDTKNKKSVEELENQMVQKLKSLGINPEKQLFINNLSSNYKSYLLKSTDVMKTKTYDLLVYDGLTASKVILELEKINIANVRVLKTEHSQEEQILADLKRKAILKAKKRATALTLAIGQKVGNAIYISDQGNVTPRYNQTVMLSAMYKSAEAADAQPADLDFKKIEYNSRISVTFKLE